MPHWKDTGAGHLGFCPERLRYRDAEPHAGSLYKAQDQEVQRVGTAHRGQRLGAQAASHNYGIGKAVQLLEQGSQHQRQRKH